MSSGGVGRPCLGVARRSMTIDLSGRTQAVSIKSSRGREAGLVTSERRGSWAFYVLHPVAAEWVRETLAALSR